MKLRYFVAGLITGVLLTMILTVVYLSTTVRPHPQ
jgi:hypothetical protein